MTALAHASSSDTLEWVWLSPDSSLQEAYRLEALKSPPGAPVLRITQESLIAGKPVRKVLEVDAVTAADLRGILKVSRWSEFAPKEPKEKQSCTQRVRWEVVRAGKIAAFCGADPSAKALARLSQAIQVLVSGKSAAP